MNGRGVTILGVRVVADPGGAWRISMVEPLLRASEGRLGPDATESIAVEVERLRRMAPVAAVVPGRDRRCSLQEDRVGRALSAVLRASPDLAQRFGEALGGAAARRETLLVAVDAPDAGVADIPWELIADAVDGPLLEAAGHAVIARALGRRAAAAPAHDALTVDAWAPTPDDPACATVLAALEPVLDARRPHTGPAAVLHVVCHGRLDGERLAISLEDREAHPGEVGHLLVERVRSARLVVLDVCEGGAVTPVFVDGLAARLCASGAPLVVAPAGPCDVRAAVAFSEGLHAALAGGANVPESVAAGRRRVRELALGHPHARWFNHLFYLGDAAEGALRPLEAAAWRPATWPVPSPAAAAYLGATRRESDRRGDGYVGLGHFAAALDRDADPEIRRLRAALASAPAASEPTLTAKVDCGCEPDAVPRVLRAGERLRPGFTVLDVWRALATESGHPLGRAASEVLMRAASGAGDTTWAPAARHAPAEPACGIEVVGGPEDGRRFAPAPGDSLGRHGGGASHAFYADAFATDLAMSRRHAAWLGRGRVVLHAPAEMERAGGLAETVVGEVELRAGDVLRLGTTRLLAT